MPLVERAKGTYHNKYVPHSSTREQERRLRQIRRGTLRGAVVSESARYGAHGLIGPDDLQLVKELAHGKEKAR